MLPKLLGDLTQRRAMGQHWDACSERFPKLCPHPRAFKMGRKRVAHLGPETREVRQKSQNANKREALGGFDQSQRRILTRNQEFTREAPALELGRHLVQDPLRAQLVGPEVKSADKSHLLPGWKFTAAKRFFRAKVIVREKEREDSKWNSLPSHSLLKIRLVLGAEKPKLIYL